MISSLFDAVLHAMDDAIYSAAYWVLDSKDDLQQATGRIVNADKIHTFQEIMGARASFVALFKENISSGLQLHDIVPALAYIPVPIPNFLLMEISQLRFCSTTFALT